MQIKAREKVCSVDMKLCMMEWVLKGTDVGDYSPPVEVRWNVMKTLPFLLDCTYQQLDRLFRDNIRFSFD